MSSLADIVPDIVKITGPLLVAFFLNWGLYGALSIQIYMYYQNFSDDMIPLQLLVYGIYLLECAQTFLITQSAFKMFGQEYGNLAALDQVGTFWLSVPIIGGIVAFLVQSFYAYRISILSRSRILYGIIMVLACIQLGSALALSVTLKRVGMLSKVPSLKEFFEPGLWEGSSAACDLFIAGCMIYSLKKRDTGMKDTHDIISRIIRTTIETGSVTAAVATIGLCLTYLPLGPPRTYYQTCFIVVGKLYSTTMLVVLNNRVRNSDVHSRTAYDSHPIPLFRTRQSSRTQNVTYPPAHSEPAGLRRQPSFPSQIGSLSNVSDFKVDSTPA